MMTIKVIEMTMMIPIMTIEMAKKMMMKKRQMVKMIRKVCAKKNDFQECKRHRSLHRWPGRNTSLWSCYRTNFFGELTSRNSKPLVFPPCLHCFVIVLFPVYCGKAVQRAQRRRQVEFIFMIIIFHDHYDT